MSKRKPLDPVVEKFLKGLREDYPGDPLLDQMVATLAENPELFYRSRRLANYLESLLLVASKVKMMVAEKLGRPQLADNNYLTVELEEDWRINAEVEQEPPYHIYVSTNLYEFCARLSELLIGGLGVTVTDEGEEGTKAAAAPRWSKAEVTRKVKSVLDRFCEDRTIPAENSKLAPEHTSLHQITFYSIMAFIVGHEFGHVVINEERRWGITETAKPYADFAEGMLRANVQQLLYTPMHDPNDLVGLGKLDRRELQRVASRWVDEITADLIGVDLARKYHRDFGPAKSNPDIVPIVNMSLHLCFMAQMVLYLYLNHRDPKFPLTSTTHPPIDFRMHCVVSWMYPNPQHPSVLTFINYCQEILNGVLSDPAEPSPKGSAPQL